MILSLFFAIRFVRSPLASPTLTPRARVAASLTPPRVRFARAHHFGAAAAAAAAAFCDGCASAIAARYIKFCCNRVWYVAQSLSLPTFWFSKMARMRLWFSSRYFCMSSVVITLSAGGASVFGACGERRRRSAGGEGGRERGRDDGISSRAGRGVDDDDDDDERDRTSAGADMTPGETFARGEGPRATRTRPPTRARAREV